MGGYHEQALKPGSTLADYTIQSVLGHGGFSVTYLARDNALGADVAIKEYMPQEVAVRDGRTAFVIPRANQDAIRHYHWGLKNFVKEARALARFKHPNIVRVLRFIEANGTAYTVMEYERGQTLAQHLKDNGQRLDESGLLRIVMPILNGLHAVHELGLLHLDIKPENIYLRRDGSPMLIDFGSARHAMTESRPTGRITLTHGYAPVEQYPDKGKLGPWSDVYALGATMYRCMSGKRPDDALDRYRALLDYKTDPLWPVAKAGAGRFQPPILECVDRAIQVHAKDRPQSAREFQDYLLGRTKLPRSTPAVAAVRRARPGRVRRTGRRIARGVARLARSIIVVSLLGAAGVGGWLAWPHLTQMWERVSATVAARAPASSTAAPRAAPKRSVQSARKSVPAARPVVAKTEVPPVPTVAALPAVLHASLAGHEDWVQALAFAPGGKRLATAGNDRTVRVWDLPAETVAAVLRQEHPVNAVHFAPDGRTLATAGADGAVHLWELSSDALTGRLQASTYPLFSVAYAPDGRSVAAAGKDRILYVWSLSDGGRRAFEGHSGAINAIAFRPDGKGIVSAGADRIIRVWNAESGQEVAALPGHKDPILALALSPDGRWLASGDAGHTIRLWDMRTLTHAHTLTAAREAVLSLAFGPNGAWLAAGSADHGIYVFDVEAGRLVQTLRGHADYVQAVGVSPDGRLLASGGRDHAVRLWEPR